MRKANITIHLDKTKLFVNDQELPVYKFYQTENRENIRKADSQKVTLQNTLTFRPAQETVVPASV